MRIGIDIGSVCSDAVLMAGREIVTTCKVPTTPNLADCVGHAVAPLLQVSHVRPGEIDAVMVCIGSLGRTLERMALVSGDPGEAPLDERLQLRRINRMLGGVTRRTLRSITHRLRQLKIPAPVFVGTNDGALVGAKRIARSAVRALDAGVAMALRGAHVLSGCDDAYVIKAGGSRTLIGILEHGTIRLQRTPITVGGIAAAMQLPEVLPIDIGGGTVMVQEPNAITMAEMAVASGRAHIGEVSRVSPIRPELVRHAIDKFDRAIETGIAHMTSLAGRRAIVTVGGAAPLIAPLGSLHAPMILTTHHAVAGAIGVASAALNLHTDRVYSYQAIGRVQALNQARARALRKLYEAGAVLGSAMISTIEELPVPADRDDQVRVCVTATAKAPG